VGKLDSRASNIFLKNKMLTVFHNRYNAKRRHWRKTRIGI
jgi:ribosomal protein L39E